MKKLIMFILGVTCGVLLDAYFSHRTISKYRETIIEYSNELDSISSRVNVLYAKYMTSGYWLYYYRPEDDTSRYYDTLDSLWIDLRQNINMKGETEW